MRREFWIRGLLWSKTRLFTQGLYISLHNKRAQLESNVYTCKQEQFNFYSKDPLWGSLLPQKRMPLIHFSHILLLFEDFRPSTCLFPKWRTWGGKNILNCLISIAIFAFISKVKDIERKKLLITCLHVYYDYMTFFPQVPVLPVSVRAPLVAGGGLWLHRVRMRQGKQRNTMIISTESYFLFIYFFIYLIVIIKIK